MVKIYVGPGRIVFNRHEELLCDKVQFFKSAFQTGFKESREKEMDMPDDDMVTFGHFIEWLYTGRFVCKRCPNKGTWEQGSEVPAGVDAEHELEWCRLWVFANKLGINGLMKQAYRQYDRCLRSGVLVISPEAVKYVHENTTEDCEVRSRQVQAVVQEAFSGEDTGEGSRKTLFADSNFSDRVFEGIKEHMRTAKGSCNLGPCELHDIKPWNEPDISGWGNSMALFSSTRIGHFLTVETKCQNRGLEVVGNYMVMAMPE